jgi:hypothetical protein
MDLEMAGRSTGVADHQQDLGLGASEHLCVAEAVSYIDRTIPPRVRAQVEYHLVHCEACLEEIIDVSLFLRGLNGPGAKSPVRAGERVPDGKG